MNNKMYIVFDIIGPNGYIPYVYNKKTLSSIMKWELNNIHNNDYFHEIPKLSSHVLVHKNKYDDGDTYLIPIDWNLEETPLKDILTPDFLKFIKNKHNFFIIYVNYNYEQPVHSLV